MTSYAFATHIVFCCCLALLSALAVRLMIAARLLDHPTHRSAHTSPTPKGGGVGIVVAFLVGIAVLYRFAAFSRIADPYFRAVILASVAIALVSLLDDLRNWPFIVKLATQLVAAAVAIGAGLSISVVRLPYVGPVEVGVVGPVVTLGWIVFATNAMNFIDGMNGLAAGCAFLACGFLAYIAAGQGGWFVYFAAMILAAGLAGFLPFNYPRARIFMGDVGSQFCGFMLAVLAVAAGQFEQVDLSFLLVPFLLSGVLFDVGFTLIRRILAGEKLTEAHHGHLYQVAARSGMDPRVVTAIYWGFTAYGGVACLLFLAAPSTDKPALVLLPAPLLLAWAAYVARRARRAGLGPW
jgi:UDP-GlcNAc:undecaprenyl-phosphate/decaprenyl-phosphate GlcNAc-1-phosphate transferase